MWKINLFFSPSHLPLTWFTVHIIPVAHFLIENIFANILCKKRGTNARRGRGLAPHSELRYQIFCWRWGEDVDSSILWRRYNIITSLSPHIHWWKYHNRKQDQIVLLTFNFSMYFHLFVSVCCSQSCVLTGVWRENTLLRKCFPEAAEFWEFWESMSQR